jgi:hypothetical protein
MVNITNSTVSGNAGIYNTGGTLTAGGIYNEAPVLIRDSIVAANTIQAPYPKGGTPPPPTISDCQNPVSDQGYNLESATSCGFTGTGSLQNVDPKLDPGGLRNNGGPTQTIALQSAARPSIIFRPLAVRRPTSGA